MVTNKTYKDAHLEVCDILYDFGSGDGSIGSIEHSDENDKTIISPLSLAGSLIFGIEDILEKEREKQKERELKIGMTLFCNGVDMLHACMTKGLQSKDITPEVIQQMIDNIDFSV